MYLYLGGVVSRLHYNAPTGLGDRLCFRILTHPAILNSRMCRCATILPLSIFVLLFVT